MSAHPIPSWPTLRPMGHLRAFIADPIGLFTEAHQRFGPVVKIRFLSEPVLSVSTPDAAHRILVDNARNYVKDTPGYTVLRRLLGLGLVTAEGADWRRKRRIANPAFHRRCLAGFVETMNTATADWSATLHARADTEAPVEMSGELVKLTLRIAGETLFHVDLTEESDGVSRAVRTALECFNDQLMTALPPLSWLPLPGARRMDEAIADLDRVVQGIIDGRRSNPEEKADLLGMLMGLEDEETGTRLSDKELRDEVVTMLLAGHETTANALSWGMWLLAEAPEVAAKAADEVRGVCPAGPIGFAELAELPYLRATVKEVLRLYPPVWLLARRAVEDDVIEGFHVPAGRVVFFAPWLLHRDERHWPDPETLDPMRFVDEAVMKARPSAAYLPFSSGARKCIGDRFAEAEIAVVLGHVLRDWTLARKADHEPGHRASVALGPLDGVPVHVRPRA